jgi:hypothetical protein
MEKPQHEVAKNSGACGSSINLGPSATAGSGAGAWATAGLGAGLSGGALDLAAAGRRAAAVVLDVGIVAPDVAKAQAMIF